MQRFFDILFSGTAIIVLSPLLIPVMVILRFTGEGEVFYRQKRVGKDGRMFYLLKFATMLKDSPIYGNTDSYQFKGWTQRIFTILGKVFKEKQSLLSNSIIIFSLRGG